MAIEVIDVKTKTITSKFHWKKESGKESKLEDCLEQFNTFIQQKVKHFNLIEHYIRSNYNNHTISQ